MKTLFKIVTYIIFPIIILILIYLIYDSVNQPLKFNKEVAKREAVAIDRLKSIRTLQEAYKSNTGRYLSDADSLIDFYKNGQITVIKQVGSMDDSLAVAQKRVYREKINIAVRDTLLKSKRAVIDSIAFIPFSGGKKINMESIVKVVSGVNIPLFEATMPYDDLLFGLERQLIVNLKAEKEDMGRYPGIKVGDINNPNNNAGNWE